MKTVSKVIKEQFKYFYLIRRLSVFEIKINNRNNYLGPLWEIFNLVIQLIIYWFVFQNVRQASEVKLSNGHTVPFVFWLYSGFILWMFFYKSATDGSSSIYQRIRITSRMNFPLSIIPNVVIFSQLYIHLVMIVIAVVIFNIGGVYVNIHYLEFLYFIPASVIFLFALSLVTSTFSAMARDFHQLFNAFLRMLLYVSPVLWEIGKLDGIYGNIVKLNPLYYLIEGYRSAFFGTEWYFIEHLNYTLYFWLVTIVLLAIGTTVHTKFKRHFVDYL